MRVVTKSTEFSFENHHQHDDHHLPRLFLRALPYHTEQFTTAPFYNALQLALAQVHNVELNMNLTNALSVLSLSPLRLLL